MTNKDIVRRIRGTGGAARILGGINVVLIGTFYIFALFGGGQMAIFYHFTSLMGIAVGWALFVIGRRVYSNPDQSQKDGIYMIIFLSFLALLIGIINKGFPFFFVMLIFFGINTLQHLKKHGSITNLHEVLADLANPIMTDAERKKQKKAISRNIWKTIGLAFGTAFVLFSVFIAIVALFAEKFERDTKSAPIYINEPNAI